jgi:hypothetical protein
MRADQLIQESNTIPPRDKRMNRDAMEGLVAPVHRPPSIHYYCLLLRGKLVKAARAGWTGIDRITKAGSGFAEYDA